MNYSAGRIRINNAITTIHHAIRCVDNDGLVTILLQCRKLGEIYNLQYRGDYRRIPNGEILIPLQMPFSLMSAIDQIAYLRRRYEQGESTGDSAKGKIAEELRSKRHEMKLAGLFNIDKQFMNIELRDFLNVNEHGKDCYTWNEIKYGNGWREIPSIGSQ